MGQVRHRPRIRHLSGDRFSNGRSANMDQSLVIETIRVYEAGGRGAMLFHQFSPKRKQKKKKGKINL